MPQARTRGEGPTIWPYALGAGITALVVRLPFLTSLPPTWDSVQFCLGILHYDIELHQPHPPGYFLYVYTAKAIQALGLSPYASLVALSVVAGAVMAGLLAGWAGKLAGREAALATGVMAVISPLAWNYATTGDTYAVSGMMAALVGWLCWGLYRGGRVGSAARTPQSPPLQAAASGLALAVAGGMRPTDALFLFPLWVYCVARRGGKAVLLGLAVLGAGTAAWAAPMLRTTGGLARYLEISHRLSAGVMRASPWAEPGQAGHYLGALGLAALAVLFAGWAFLPLARGTALTRARLFLALWLAPAALFFVAVHLGTPGYLMVLAPPLMLLAGIGLGRARGGREPHPPAPFSLAGERGREESGGEAGGGAAGQSDGRDARRTERARTAMSLAVVIGLNGLFLKTTVIDGQRAQARCFREIQAACAPYAGPETAVLTTPGRTGAPHSDLPFRTAMYLLPECRVFLYPLDSTGPVGGIPNEGYRMRSYIRAAPVRVGTRQALVDASLLKYLGAFPPPRLVVSNAEGELWLVQTRGGMVLGEGEPHPPAPSP